MNKLGFIGFGNMGSAIVRGVNNKLGNTAVFVYDADPEKLKGLTHHGATAAGSVGEIAKRCGYIVLAVKPQQLDEVLEEIKKAEENEGEVIEKESEDSSGEDKES